MLIKRKSLFQNIWDLVGCPLRFFLLNESLQKRLRLTTLKEERINETLGELKGKVLDIGCGENELIQEYRKYGNKGIGADIIQTKGVDIVIKNSPKLPFKKAQFDTVSLVASLNHIPKKERLKLLKEIRRVLKKEGIVVVSMINPIIGLLCHKLTYWDFDQKQRKINFDEEDYGLSNPEVEGLFMTAGFKLERKKRFIYGLNNLFIFKKYERKKFD